MHTSSRNLQRKSKKIGKREKEGEREWGEREKAQGNRMKQRNAKIKFSIFPSKSYVLCRMGCSQIDSLASTKCYFNDIKMDSSPYDLLLQFICHVIQNLVRCCLVIIFYCCCCIMHFILFTCYIFHFTQLRVIHSVFYPFFAL